MAYVPSFLLQEDIWIETSRFYWKGITNDVCEYIRTCDVCQCTNDAK